MKYFKTNGLWFLGDAPQNRVAGTLSYSKHGLFLRLIGGLRGGWSPTEERYPLIQGVVSKNPYGEFVTLIDCFTRRKTLSPVGIGSETLLCNWGIAGDTHLGPEYDEFEALDIKVSYLDDWFGRNGVSITPVPGEGFGLDVSYRKPESVRFPVNQTVVTLGMAAKSSESPHGITITEKAHLFIRPLPRLTVEQVQGEYVKPLQNLLSFATDSPNEVQDIELRGKKVVIGKFERNRRYRLLYNPIFRLKSKKDRLTKDDMLFNLDEAQESGLNVFERWFEFTKRYEAFCTVYFALLYAPPKYLDEKFQRLMSAFTQLCGSLGVAAPGAERFVEDVGRAVHAHFSEREREALSHLIPTTAQAGMTLDLRRLLEEHGGLMGQVITDFDWFVKAVSNTLRYIETREALAEHPRFEGSDLLYATWKVRLLIKILVLGQLGFDAGRIASFMQRNKEFLHLKALASMA